MRLCTHQPIFLPWPGFFWKALHADVMVLLDTVQFPLGRGWMSRNRVKSDQGELWLSVPVRRKGLGLQRIDQVVIAEDGDWRRTHLRGIRHQYAHAPYLGEYLPAIEAAYSRGTPGDRRLLEHNLALIRVLWDGLGIRCRLVLQSDLQAGGQGTELLVGICQAAGAKAYIALPQAAAYIDASRFEAAGIELKRVPFRPPVYPQLWGEFRYNLSTLDLLLTCGPKARDILAGVLKPR